MADIQYARGRWMREVASFHTVKVVTPFVPLLRILPCTASRRSVLPDLPGSNLQQILLLVVHVSANPTRIALGQQPR